MITVLSAGKELEIPQRFMKLLAPIVSIAPQYGAKLYIYGGFLRDLIEGKMPADCDIYVEGFPSTKFTHELMERHLADRKEDYVGPIPMKEDILMMLSEIEKNGFEFDFVSSSMESIQDYIKRNDFTINTLYYDLQNKKLFDPSGRGVKDIKSRTLYPNSFNITPVEVLRAIKLVVVHDYQLSPESVAVIQKAAPRLGEVGRGSFLKILTKAYAKNPAKADELVKKLGLTEYIPAYLAESLA